MYPYPNNPQQGQQPSYPPQPYPTQQPSGGYPSPYPVGGAPYPGQVPYPAGPAPYPSTQGYPHPQPDLGFQASPYPPQPTAYPTGYPQQTTYNPYPAQQQYPGAYPPQQPGYPGQQPGAYPTSQPYGQQQFGAVTSHVAHTTHSSPAMSAQAYHEVPTIREGHFVPNDDAKALRTAMKGFGTDEAAIINVVTKRTNQQRMQIVNAYKASYGKDLIKDLKSETSGNFESVLVALMTTKYDLMASTIHDAIAGIGTKEQVLVDVLCTASNQDIHHIKAAYQRLYNRNMEKEVQGDLSGYFSRLMFAICAAGRDENPVVNTAMAAQDAQDLQRAGLKKIGTDESEFIRILITRSYGHLRTVFQEYQKITGQDIEKSIKSEFSGDIEDGLLAVVKCCKNRALYYAERLKAAMAGFGTKDNALIYILVTRAEVDLESIKQEYQRLYNKALAADVQSETSGDYKKALVTLIAGNA